MPRPRPALAPLICCCIASLALAGCASTRAVSFVMTERDDAGEVRPVRGRVLRAIPLNASPNPLPVSIENLRVAASLDRDWLIGASDETGLVTLRLTTGLPHRIELLPPSATVGSAETLTPAWRLSPDAATLEPLQADAAEAPIELDLAP